MKKLLLLLQMLAEMQDGFAPDLEVNQEFSVGDKVKLNGKRGLIYMHDFDTKDQLCKNFDFSELDQHSHLIDNYAILVEFNNDFTYNCGHCDQEHSQKGVIFFPHNGKKYHVDLDSIIVQ